MKSKDIELIQNSAKNFTNLEYKEREKIVQKLPLGMKLKLYVNFLPPEQIKMIYDEWISLNRISDAEKLRKKLIKSRKPVKGVTY